jgi:hypothetical protein
MFGLAPRLSNFMNFFGMLFRSTRHGLAPDQHWRIGQP